jgi:hypothetical protein
MKNSELLALAKGEYFVGPELTVYNGRPGPVMQRLQNYLSEKKAPLTPQPIEQLVILLPEVT